jgi:hypothetical protein
MFHWVNNIYFDKTQEGFKVVIKEGNLEGAQVIKESVGTIAELASIICTCVGNDGRYYDVVKFLESLKS